MSSFFETVFGGADSSIIHLNTDQSLSTITMPGWIQTLDATYNFRQGDYVVAVYGMNATPGNFQISIDLNGVVTLNELSNLFALDITAGEAKLAAAAKVNMIIALTGQQYKIRNLQLNKIGTNFSGGGGDRNLELTDGTTVYSIIPAATLQSLANARWGDTALPFPVSASINTSTSAGANLYLQYQGGSADYTAGSVTVTALVERVA